jgi:hypothetical protein
VSGLDLVGLESILGDCEVNVDGKNDTLSVNSLFYHNKQASALAS